MVHMRIRNTFNSTFISPKAPTNIKCTMLSTYEGRAFNSGTNAPSYHMAVRNSWKLRSISGGRGFKEWNKIMFEFDHSFKSY